ncbi:hypothetical protein DS2_17437 [Catenovulum agarivorans DS-2]|uniref:DUF4861 domain-containing protein n=1 Tax=Catenovulum agarivorans DS-2 TaxID=1328313 RepID=W7QHI0_9ALTE|nr:DUF4861 family protein [Catenovulum agarivorans]EWH08407.1 hypothetical protein DS2_17437 [Catenovulum agarivorans DS-2]
MFRTGVLSALVASLLLGCTTTSEENHSTKAVESQLENRTTFARYVPERKDDFAWENDLVAFRAYGPAARSGAENSGVDCWLKRVNYPIVNKWYKAHFEKGQSYHEDHGEGLDNYHVGSSAGCGGTSLWINDQRESLETWVRWEMVEQSTAKTSFKLYYEREIQGKTYQEEKLITIELGDRMFNVKSTFFVDGQPAANLPVTVGVTTHDEKATTATNKAKGWLAAWEVMDGYGLGTAVAVDPAKIKSFKTILSNGVYDAGHALILLETDSKGQIEYRAGYGWEKANEIVTFAQWQQYLNNHAWAK